VLAFAIVLAVAIVLVLAVVLALAIVLVLAARRCNCSVLQHAATATGDVGAGAPPPSSAVESFTSAFLREAVRVPVPCLEPREPTARTAI